MNILSHSGAMSTGLLDISHQGIVFGKNSVLPVFCYIRSPALATKRRHPVKALSIMLPILPKTNESCFTHDLISSITNGCHFISCSYICKYDMGGCTVTSWSLKYERHGPQPAMNGCIIARSAWTKCIRSCPAHSCRHFPQSHFPQFSMYGRAS